jgi:hypothetical protein
MIQNNNKKKIENKYPDLEEKNLCYICQNATKFETYSEFKTFCKVMHVITWSTAERTSVQVCSDFLQIPQTPEPPPADEYPDFEPETKSFLPE